jgi:outer membrane protein TolC
MSPLRFASSLIGFTLWIVLVPFSALWAAEPDFLTLGEIKELLLKRNVELKISQKEILMTEAQLQSHRADFFPTLSSEARYSRQGEAQRIQIDRGAFSTLPDLVRRRRDSIRL